MSIEQLFDRTVTFHRTLTETRDEIGQPSMTTETTLVTRGYLEPINAVREAKEDTSDRDTPITKWLLIVGPDVDVSGYDRAEIDGNTYDVFSEPRVFTNPRIRQTHHQEITVRRIVL